MYLAINMKVQLINLTIIIILITALINCERPEEGINGIIGEWEQEYYTFDGLNIKKNLRFDNKRLYLNIELSNPTYDMPSTTSTSSEETKADEEEEEEKETTDISGSCDIVTIEANYFINNAAIPYNIDIIYKKVRLNGVEYTNKDRNSFFTNYNLASVSNVVLQFPSLDQKALGIYEIAEPRLKLAISEPDSNIRPNYFSQPDYIFKMVEPE